MEYFFLKNIIQIIGQIPLKEAKDDHNDDNFEPISLGRIGQFDKVACVVGETTNVIMYQILY